MLTWISSSSCKVKYWFINCSWLWLIVWYMHWYWFCLKFVIENACPVFFQRTVPYDRPKQFYILVPRFKKKTLNWNPYTWWQLFKNVIIDRRSVLILTVFRNLPIWYLRTQKWIGVAVTTKRRFSNKAMFCLSPTLLLTTSPSSRLIWKSRLPRLWRQPEISPDL